MKVAEVAITFRERKFGLSKMSWRIVIEAISVLLKLTWWSMDRKEVE
ncbi:MAG: hypothetical protein RMK89_08045 [Armatimonadota bacterium]|nr:hypothetical protein [Armatimonadota bacterium]MDW8143396.1 hypothetical protein [Armatimonadota bacterium]